MKSEFLDSDKTSAIIEKAIYCKLVDDIKDIIYNAFDDCDFNIYKDEYRSKIKASIRKAETIYDSLIP
jgi:hypothetical protein